MTTTGSTQERWRLNQDLSVGREIFGPLDAASRVVRAAALLDVCRERWRPVRQINAVAQIAGHPAKWKSGHRAFRAVRDLTLREERRRTSAVYYCLLFVAENTAKTVYNATDPVDPFDEDSSWWLARNARDMVEAVGDSSFEAAVWNALTRTP